MQLLQGSDPTTPACGILAGGYHLLASGFYGMAFAVNLPG